MSLTSVDTAIDHQSPQWESIFCYVCSTTCSSGSWQGSQSTGVTHVKYRYSLRTNAAFGMAKLCVSPGNVWTSWHLKLNTETHDGFLFMLPTPLATSSLSWVNYLTALHVKASLSLKCRGLPVHKTSSIPLVWILDTKSEMPSLTTECCDCSAIVAVWALVSELTRILCNNFTHHSCRLVTVH